MKPTLWVPNKDWLLHTISEALSHLEIRVELLKKYLQLPPIGNSTAVLKSYLVFNKTRTKTNEAIDLLISNNYHNCLSKCDIPEEFYSEQNDYSGKYLETERWVKLAPSEEYNL